MPPRLKNGWTPALRPARPTFCRFSTTSPPRPTLKDWHGARRSGVSSMRASRARVSLKGFEAVLRGELRLKRPARRGSPPARRAKPDPTPPAVLTPRETELLRQVASGVSNREIAFRLQISPHTVKTHLYNVFRKIGVPNRLQASLWAVANLRG